METLEKRILNLDKKCLLCSLYTLSGDNTFFKKVDLKKSTSLELIEYNNTPISIADWNEFYQLLNKVSVRRFSFFLIKPILLESKIINEEISEYTVLLKRYLKKFKYNYFRYFAYQNGRYETLPNYKEMNMVAINSLFVLTGL